MICQLEFLFLLDGVHWFWGQVKEIDCLMYFHSEIPFILINGGPTGFFQWFAWVNVLEIHCHHFCELNSTINREVGRRGI
jgi:hypothetical protein